MQRQQPAQLTISGRRRRRFLFVVASTTFAWFSSAPAPVQASVQSQVLYARALVPFHEGRWEQAYGLFDEAVGADERDALALYYRGLTQARRGAHPAAVDDIRAAVEMEPRLPGAWLDLGIALLDAGRVDEARQALRTAYGRDQANREAAFFLALAEYRSGDAAAAIPLFDQASEDPALSQAALYYAGLAAAKAGDTSGSRDRLARAAAVAPETEIGRMAARPGSAASASQISPVAGVAPWALDASLRWEFDSNVVAGASDGIDNTDEDADMRPVLGVRGRYTLLDGPTGALVAAGDVSQSLHLDRTDFNLSALRLGLHWSTPPSMWRFGASAGYEFDGLDFAAFSQSVVLTPWVAFQAVPWTATQLHYRFRYRDYLDSPFDPFRDGFNNAVGVRQHFAVGAPGGTAHIGYTFDSELPQDTDDPDPFIAYGADDFEYLGNQLDVGTVQPLALDYVGPLQVRAGYRLRLEDYENPNSRRRTPTSAGDVARRHDLEHSVAVELARPVDVALDFLNRFEVTLGVIGQVNGSNTDEFDYERVIVALGVNAGF